MTAIIKKELRTYFTSMTGYIFLGFLVFFNALYFGVINIRQHYPDYTYALSGTTVVFLIIIPALTMRLFAEESRQKTDQLLFTAPVTVRGIVIGKYLAALLLFLTGMVITMLFPFILSRFGEISVGRVVSSYTGYILMGASFISVGIFVSVLTDNQIIAAVGTFGALFVLYMMDGLIPGMPTDRTSSLIFVAICILAFGYFIYSGTKNLYAGLITTGAGLLAFAIIYAGDQGAFFDGSIVKALSWFSLLARFQNFNSGILNFSDILYYVSFSVAFIYLTIHTIEKRRWA